MVSDLASVPQSSEILLPLPAIMAKGLERIREAAIFLTEILDLGARFTTRILQLDDNSLQTGNCDVDKRVVD